MGVNGLRVAIIARWTRHWAAKLEARRGVIKVIVRRLVVVVVLKLETLVIKAEATYRYN
jgi:hypothetical protein